VQTKVIRYGPYTVQPGAENPDGTHGHGMASGAQIAEKPCTDCYLVGMQADLVKPDGTRAGHSTNMMLHHMVMFNSEAGREDATCGTSLGRFGQRFFASGDERTPTNFPEGYGYRVGNGTWGLLWELASMATVPETAFIEVTFEYVPGSTAGMKDVEPVWMDIDQCGDSEVSIPAGPSSQNWTWTVNRPGDIVGIAGHVHDHGVNLEARNDTTGELICDSVAGYGEDPIYIDHHGEEHISSMSGCGGRGATEPVATVQNGQRVTITSHYDAPAPVPDAMGISVAYIAQAGGSSGTEECVTATNQQHTAAGRATTWLVFAWARGSNEYLGLTWASSSLQQSTAGTWARVASC
jgi:hypothetical protein